MMKCLGILLVAAGLMRFAPANALAGEVKVIANSSVKADMISAGKLKRVFLEENNSLGDGTHVEPVLEKDGPVHEAFLQEYMGRSDDNLQTYYRGLVFTGRGSMPKQLDSDAEVVAYVARTKGAIGYVSTATATEGVKLLPVLSDRPEAQRVLLTRVEPEYPETLQSLHIGGTVRLAITISAKGKVDNIELLGGNPILAESAIAAVKQWVYSAGHSRTTAEVSIPFDSRR
jgi:TonB family protein